MEGNLYKWCGPFYRWQLRFCTISNGQLDLHHSKESLHSREAPLESHYIALCEINLDKNSVTEWTIQAPGKDLVYLKAGSLEERRYWLQIIGSAKACVANASVLGSRQSSMSSNSSFPAALIEPEVAVSKSEHLTAQGSEPECLINGNKQNAEEIPKLSKSEIEHDKRIPKDLKENVIAHSSSASVEALGTVCDDLKTELGYFQEHIRENEMEAPVFLQKDAHKVLKLFNKFSEMLTTITGKSLEDFSESRDAQNANADHGSFHTTDSGYDGSGTPPLQALESCMSTFFSTVEVSFADVMNEDNDYPKFGLLSSVRTETYIAACIHYTKFIDLFAGTLLAPLKSDILSNCEKVRKGFVKDPQRYLHMQHIIEDEISRKEHLHSDSTTQAVLWMMRGLRTISGFLTNVCTPGNPAFSNAAAALESAYCDHLKRHHNFIVRRMFTVGLKLTPSYEHFKRQVVTDSDIDVNSHEIDAEIRRQTVAYCVSMSEVICSIEKIYIHHKFKL